jgi:hypothetical protein
VYSTYLGGGSADDPYSQAVYGDAAARLAPGAADESRNTRADPDALISVTNMSNEYFDQGLDVRQDFATQRAVRDRAVTPTGGE